MSVVRFYSGGSWAMVCEKDTSVFDETVFRQVQAGDSIFYNGNWLTIECVPDINYEGVLNSAQLNSTWNVSFQPELSGTKTLVLKNVGAPITKIGSAFLKGSTNVGVTIRKTSDGGLAFDVGDIEIRKNGTLLQPIIHFSFNEDVSFNYFLITGVTEDDDLKVIITEG